MQIPNMVSKRSVRYQKGVDFSTELAVNDQTKFLKLYRKSWPKFEQVTKKVPTPRTLQVSGLDE
jgi:hypothetical protein